MNKLNFCLVIFLFASFFDLAHSKEGSSKFNELCPALLSDKKDLCAAVGEKYFGTMSKGVPAEDSAHSFAMKSIAVPTSEFDSQFEVRLMADPNKFLAVGWCYMTSRGEIPKNLSAQKMGLEGASFSVSRSSLPVYKKWLQGTGGKACLATLTKDFAESAPNLESYFKPEIQSLIFVNPLALVGASDGPENFNLVFTKILNSERIIQFADRCQAFSDWTQKTWKSLKPDEVKSFEKTYPHSNLKDPVIAGKISVSSAYEDDFPGFNNKFSKMLKSCLTP